MNQKILETKIIPFISFMLGISFCVSTALMSASYIILAILILFHTNFKMLIKQAFNNKFIIMSVIFYLIFVIACIWSTGSVNDKWHMLTRIHGYMLAPLFFIVCQTNNSNKLILQGFLIGVVITAALSIISYLCNYHVLYGIRDHTWVIFHGHILHNAFLAIAASFLLLLAFNKAKSKLQYVCYLIAYFLCFIDALFIVIGRTGQVMFLLLSIFAIIYQFRSKGILLTMGLACICVPLLYFSPAIRYGFDNYQSDKARFEHGDVDTSMGLRWVFHKVSKELYLQKPIIGYGTGSFKSVYEAYIIKHNIQGKPTANPHRDILWIAVDTGIVGIIAFILMIIFAIVEICKLPFLYKGAGLSLIGGYILASIQNSFFIDNVTGITFIILLLALISSDSLNTPD